jgi:signal recognition particle GTPase
VKFIGVGEKATDLLVFDKKEFVDTLFEEVK